MTNETPIAHLRNALTIIINGRTPSGLAHDDTTAVQLRIERAIIALRGSAIPEKK